jgi:dTDP-4-amino-4,6-dideoxygalactose transaminase
MYIIGDEEIEAVARVIKSGRLFRYHEGGECARFEERWGQYLDCPHVRLCASGTNALIYALSSLGVGPGDEVIVPAHTYMATALAVLSAGAIPVIANIDESITLDPDSFEQWIGPRTKAVIPVHMWGLVCDMDPILEIARRKNILVIEDGCQCVGGAYKGRAVGSLGDAGAFSFNFFKNMTCGEGGAVISRDETAHQKVACLIDSCGFFWMGKDENVHPFASGSARASEFQGAILNAQLDRLPGMLERMRAEKKRILAETADLNLSPAPCHSLEYECGAHVVYNLPSPVAADAFAEKVGGTVCGKTGRHTASEWSPVLDHTGHVNPGMDPFKNEANRECRMDYNQSHFQRSLDILNRSVMVATHPKHGENETEAIIRKIRAAAETLCG